MQCFQSFFIFIFSVIVEVFFCVFLSYIHFIVHTCIHCLSVLVIYNPDVKVILLYQVMYYM